MASSSESSTRPARRTQAERRETTRAALLEATIECLVEYGYVRTTTTRIVQRAGVSRGAQVHHFPTKAELVADALSHLARKRQAQLRGRLPALPEGERRTAALVDLLWEAHSGSVFDATLELWVAARTDSELRRRLRVVEREVTGEMWTTAAQALGDEALTQRVRDDLEFALAAVRGVALLRATSGESSPAVTRRWEAARERLVALLSQ